MKRKAAIITALILFIGISYLLARGFVDYRIKKQEEGYAREEKNMATGILREDYELPDVTDIEFGVINWETELSNYGDIVQEAYDKVEDLKPRSENEDVKDLLTKKGKLIKPCYIWLRSWNNEAEGMSYKADLENMCVVIGDWTFIFDDEGVYPEHYLHKGSFTEKEKSLLYQTYPAGICIDEGESSVWLKPSTSYLNWIGRGYEYMPKGTPLP